MLRPTSKFRPFIIRYPRSAGLQELVIDGSGGSLLGGQIDLIRIATPLALGGSLTGGTIDLARVVSQIATAGGLIGGPADMARVVALIAAEGGLAGGDASALRSVSISPLGGSLSGGTASILKIIDFISSHGAILGGISPYNKVQIILAILGAIGGGESGIEYYEYLPLFKIGSRYLFPKELTNIDRYDELTQSIIRAFLGDDFNLNIIQELDTTSGSASKFKQEVL